MSYTNSSKFFTAFFTCACVIAVSSCQKIMQGPGYIGVNVSAANLSTKSAPITAATLQRFTLDAYLDEEGYNNETGETVGTNYISQAEIAHNGDEWVFTDGAYLWLNKITTRFWAYAPLDTQINGVREINPETVDMSGQETLSFSYVLPAGGHTDAAGNNDDALRQDDLIFAGTFKTWKEGEHTSHDYDKVDLRFRHALSQIRFMINTSSTFADGLDMESISITNLKTSGSCVFKCLETVNIPFTWSNLEGSGTFTQSVSKADFSEQHKKVSGAYILAKEKSFMMLPQTLDGATVVIVFKRSDDSLVTRTVTLDADKWLAGKYYTYNIVATMLDSQIQLDVSYVDWEDGGTGNL